MRRIVVSCTAAERLRVAAEWLAARPAAGEALVVAASAAAGAELVRRASLRRGAAFGWRRATLGRLAVELATRTLAAEGVAPVGPLAGEAVVARAIQRVGAAGLGRFAPVATSPGFARALARTLSELRLEAIDGETLDAASPELRALAAAYDEELRQGGLTDRAGVLRRAAAVAADPAARHPLLDLPLLLLDLPLASALEERLVAALVARAPDTLATAAEGDARAVAGLEVTLGATPEALPTRIGDAEPRAGGSLRRLQAHLFGEAPAACAGDPSVALLSAPGESRECVEIARRVAAAARAGVPFDRMAVLLRNPAEYRPHLEEALARAQVPAYFARGVVRPDPAGRAFLALLRCAGEGLSARRFSEYLSLGQVPDADPAGAPPPALPAAERWSPPEEELVPERLAAELPGLRTAEETPADEESAPQAAAAGAAGPEAPVVAGTLRAPRHWERLLVEAAVIGGRERWARRLDGLAESYRLDLEALEDPDDPAAARLRRDLADLETLRAYALPLLDDLEALPAAASWGVWLDRLSALATRALRRPERVLASLAQLAPMADLGPVDLTEVCRVLGRHLLEITLQPPAERYGRVFVGPIEAARGLDFERVLVPGLAERLFPGRIAQDPILLDRARAALAPGLAVDADRIGAERLAFRLAVGAAGEEAVLSYPRLDLEAARPRVPSFYALEALRAAEGRLPLFEELAQRAETVADTRLGWPAPRRPTEAIDEAEYDLALLDGLLAVAPDETVGAAHYLVRSNPHLGRALRFRGRRWLRRWTPADGLVQPEGAAAAALARHLLSARSYSPTALQNYATCPYKFFLYSIHKLAPREEPEAIEEMDPLQRGSLVHETQFETLLRLRAAGLLPVRPESLAEARAVLDAVLDEVAARARDDLAPAIPRVWDDGIAAVRADLREWLRRMSRDESGFVPWRFELSFGLAERRARDPNSVGEPVALDEGIRLRGSIDLIERRGDRLRVTDHKTGKARVEEGARIAGGEALQPVLYALTVEKLFPEATVDGGRLYYCTAAGGFQEREVALDAEARQAARLVATTVGDALERGFLPAMPAPRACRWCDYLEVCGPYEELRTRRKPPAEIEPLQRLRDEP